MDLRYYKKFKQNGTYSKSMLEEMNTQVETDIKELLDYSDKLEHGVLLSKQSFDNAVRIRDGYTLI